MVPIVANAFLILPLFLSTAVALYPVYHDPTNPAVGHQLFHYPASYYLPQQVMQPDSFSYTVSPVSRQGPLYNLLSNVCENVLSFCPSCPSCSCPSCPSCSCSTCSAAPTATATLTSCGSASASPGGNIAISTAITSTCQFTIVIYSPYTKVTVTCTDIAAGLTFSGGTANPSTTPVAGTTYTLSGTTKYSYVLSFAAPTNGFAKRPANRAANYKPTCTWTSS